MKVKKLRKAAVFAMLLSSTTSAFAQTVPVTDSTAHSKTVNVDLSSTVHNLHAGKLLGLGQVVISEQGKSISINGQSSITAAERLAVYQIFTTGHQSIVLGANGNAVGGSFSIGPHFSQYANSLLIPSGVSAFQIFSNSSSMVLSGNLTNAGNLFISSSNPAISTGLIGAANIVNLPGASISSSINLQMIAAHSFVNAGSIYSAGSFSASAGASLINALPSGATGLSPIIQSVNALLIQAPAIVNQGSIASLSNNLSLLTNSLNNSGVMQATSGSIDIRSLTGNVLVVNNNLGQIIGKDVLSFSTSAVGLDNSSTTSLSELSVSGGNLNASKVYFDSPNGSIDVETDKITGAVSVSGNTAVVGTNSGGLNLVSMNLAADPVFFSHDPVNGLTLSGLGPTGGGDFVALSAGDITTSQVGPVSVDASNSAAGAKGGSILLAAGVNFSPAAGVSPSNCPGGNCAGVFSISGPSLRGGSILLPNVSFQTNGNSITLSANQGKGSSGAVTVSVLNSSGAGGACCYPDGINNTSPPGNPGQNGGNISVTAAGAINTGAIRSFGGGGGGGIDFSAPGGAGGDGGTVILSSGSSITVTGEINSSGGGGGGAAQNSARYTGTATTGVGGRGGNGGNITIITPTSFVATGVILAAGGGGGAGSPISWVSRDFTAGGGSFGGGGGGGDGGAGGGGYYGGGGSGNFGSGAGGGFFGPGASDFTFVGAQAVGNAGLGIGGDGSDPYVPSVQPGGIFGVGGSNQSSAGNAGIGPTGGAAGSTGSLSHTSASFNVKGTIGSTFGPIGVQFASSPFANQSIITTTPAISSPPLPPPPSNNQPSTNSGENSSLSNIGNPSNPFGIFVTQANNANPVTRNYDSVNTTLDGPLGGNLPGTILVSDQSTHHDSIYATVIAQQPTYISSGGAVAQALATAHQMGASGNSWQAASVPQQPTYTSSGGAMAQALATAHQMGATGNSWQAASVPQQPTYTSSAGAMAQLSATTHQLGIVGDSWQTPYVQEPGGKGVAVDANLAAYSNAGQLGHLITASVATEAPNANSPSQTLNTQIRIAMAALSQSLSNQTAASSGEPAPSTSDLTETPIEGFTGSTTFRVSVDKNTVTVVNTSTGRTWKFTGTVSSGNRSAIVTNTDLGTSMLIDLKKAGNTTGFWDVCPNSAGTGGSVILHPNGIPKTPDSVGTGYYNGQEIPLTEIHQAPDGSLKASAVVNGNTVLVPLQQQVDSNGNLIPGKYTVINPPTSPFQRLLDIPLMLAELSELTAIASPEATGTQSTKSSFSPFVDFSSPLNFMFPYPWLATTSAIAAIAPSEKMAPSSTATKTLPKAVLREELKAGRLEQAHIKLKDGNALVIAIGKTLLDADSALISMEDGAKALIMKNADCVAIYNLHDRGQGQITLTVNNQVIPIALGTELILSKSFSGDFESVNPGRLIPYRHVEEFKLKDGRKVFIAGFSILSALRTVKPLSEMLRSKSAEHRKICSEILRSAACLGILKAADGPYRPAKAL